MTKALGLPVAEVSIKMEHVDSCCCRYTMDSKTTEDVKLIDTRCIGSFLVVKDD